MNFHISPITGEPGKCQAKKQCPFGGAETHFETAQEARIAFEKLNQTFSTSLNSLKAQFFKPIYSGWKQESAQKRTEELVDEFKDLKKRLDKEAIEILKSYTIFNSEVINKTLRGIPLDEEYTSDFEAQAKRLQEIIKEHEIKSTPRLLHRYLKVPDGLTPEEFIEQNFNEDSWSDPAFLSTSEDSAFMAANKRYRKRNMIVLNLVASGGISLQSDQERAGSLQSFEKERLLQAAMKFKIVENGMSTYKIPKDRVELTKHYKPGYMYGSAVTVKVPSVNLIAEDLLG